MSSAGRRARIPLALVVSRYFLFVLVGVLLFGGIPVGVFTWQMENGTILAANYGETHLQEVAEALASQERFDPDAIPSAYRYARFSADDALLETDLPDSQLAIARTLIASPEGVVQRQEGFGSQLFYVAMSLPDGGRCVLCHELMPQWADKGARDTLPNPQDLLVWTVLLALVLTIALGALRAGRRLTREMGSLARAAKAIGDQDLDTPVGGSRVAEVDDLLRAMEEMRASLKESIEAREVAERQSREQVAALAHDLKTPLTVALGNAELLAEDAEAGGLSEEQAASAQAIRDAARSMDAFVDKITEVSRGRAEGLRFEPVDPVALADRLESAAGQLAAAHRLTFETTRTAEFEDGCAAISRGETPLPRWDADALERAVLNLVSNACDHAGGSHVYLELSCSDQGLSVAVEDDGEGLSPEVLAHGTERFYRGDSARTSGRGGSHFGLGLTIAAEAADAHGGRLELSNRTDGSGRVLGGCAVLWVPLSMAEGR